jgi:Ca-activated chloride channel homolog
MMPLVAVSDFGFASPRWLWALTGTFALAIAYLVAQRQRQRYEVRFTNLALIDSVMPERPQWRRHLPPMVFLSALTALVLAMAQPVLQTEQPRSVATVMLAIDVSPSMQATDVPPSRLTQATSSAASFVDLVPDTFQVGLLAFAGTAEVLVPPTTDHDMVRAALTNLDYRSETAIGEAIFTGLDAIDASVRRSRTEEAPQQLLVLSDGASTTGRPLDEAVEAARTARVPVSTIAFGTPEGVVELGGETLQVSPDEHSLEQVADATAGQFYRALTGPQLRAVYERVSMSLATVPVQQDVTRAFLAAALVLGACAAGLSLSWFGRLP